MRISRYNKPWNGAADIDEQDRFREAMKVCEEELFWQLNSIAKVSMPGRVSCEEAWNKKE